MLNITKRKDEAGYYFNFDNGEHDFGIFFGGNLDLYWTINSKKFIPIPDDCPTKAFVITKENYFIYSLFENLYEDIKNCNVFYVADYELDWCETEEEKQKKLEQNKSMNADYKKDDRYKNLFHDGVIEWRSDDYPYDEASFITIQKNNDNFLIIFNKSGEIDFAFQTYAIRFRNSGSRYHPFNAVFMRMYGELINYEPDYHQIHFEELLYQKKLKKM